MTAAAPPLPRSALETPETPETAASPTGATVPVALGIGAIGLAFGALVVHAGLAWWWATVFATVVFAGSLEFLLVGLVAAAAPVSAIAVTALLVNVRHVFYAVSFPLHRVRGRLARAYSTFALTDEAYALTATGGWTSGRILRLQGSIHLAWVAGATAGALLGGLLPPGVAGLDFALTALVTVLTLDAVRTGGPATPLLATLSAAVAALVLPGQMLPVAFALLVGGLLAGRLISRNRRARRA
jgi:4-azaleucine resistance transporter AzlC